MSTISKKLMGFMFSGSALNLASAAFKGNINSITGFNSAGTAYASFRPTSNFNSLTQLVQDGVYIVDAKTPGFDIPGAVLAAGAPPNVAAVINKALMGFLYGGSSPLVLASASWKGNVGSITGFNSAGTAYISYRPTSTFNSLTQLVQDEAYIINSTTLGFSLPGAVLTLNTGSASPSTSFTPAGSDYWSNKSDVVLPSGEHEHDSFAYLTFDVSGSGSLTALLSANSTNGNAALLQNGQFVAVVGNNTPVQVTAGRYQLYEPGHAAGGSQYTTITNVSFGGNASA
ncbi:MAG: hypothetical protein EOO63_18275, partial [Hymenobacter sp.]